MSLAQHLVDTDLCNLQFTLVSVHTTKTVVNIRPGDSAETVALHFWKLSWDIGELWVATQPQISSHSDLLEVWRQAAQFVVTQVQISSD